MGLQYSSVVNAPLDEVFAWHERPGALPRLLPPWQPLKVAQEASSLVDGQAVLRLPGGVRWVAQHSDDDPPRRFVDELVSLPLHWRHTHTFEAIGDPHDPGHRPRRHARSRARSCCRPSATGTSNWPTTWPRTQRIGRTHA